MTTLRCAIYTRKSSEEGLDQSFNSLDAQREACEAYVISQKSEGWKALGTHYDDGGWSGGSMERPALQRLLADITAGLVDIIVVYKVDRLTRSLHDFARMVDVFDRHGVSFVSVTQAFNTTSSMGRLTLNVLLSFAQFEREVTGERIRDKIAASKAKGMWMGGYPPVGYDQHERTLLVNPEGAELVNRIYRRYLELGSVHALCTELKDQGVVTRSWTSAAGNTRGGVPFGRGSLFQLLRNRIYLGEIVHKDTTYPGQHEGIVDQELFDAVQKVLAGNRVTQRKRTETRAPLTGLLHDAAGNRMTPAHAKGKSGQRYLYYVSAPLQLGQELPANAIRRVAAPPLETLVLDRLRLWSCQPEAGWPALLPMLRRVELHRSVMLVDVIPGSPEIWRANIGAAATITEMAGGVLRVSIAITLPVRGGAAWRIEAKDGKPKISHDAILVAALRRAHSELQAAGVDLLDPATGYADARGIKDPYLRKLRSLAFLAPDIQRTILEGQQPAGLTLGRMLEIAIPADWNRQREMFGFTHRGR